MTILGPKKLCNRQHMDCISGVGINLGSMCITCPRVRHQVEDLARLRVDVEAHVHVPLGQVNDKVRIIVH